MNIEQYILDKFTKIALEEMEIDPLWLDKFFHDGFYDPLASIEANLNQLQLFLKNERD